MRNTSLVFTILLVLLMAGCKIRYSFTGGDFGELETVSIVTFPNRAPLAQPTLSQKFTEDLKDIFLQQSPLTLVAKNGDIHFEGEIVDYNTKPLAITGNETAALNRLTVAVNVRFTNTKDDSKNFEQRFTRFADYESAKQLSQVEDNLIQEINNQLTQDIFNKAVTNW